MPVTIEGLDEIMRKLDSLDDPPVMRPPMTKAVDYLNGKLQKDVSKAGGAFSRMATPGQRRAYWAKVRDNPSIHGPQGYIRSGTLYRGWQKKVAPDGRSGEVWNDTPYGEYVQGERQQPFHAASRYPRADRVAKDEEAFVAGIFRRAYERALQK